MASIIVKTGEQDDDFYPLGRRARVIDRAEMLPIQINDEYFLHKHIQIFYDPAIDGYHAIDMNSLCGVLINGHKIAHEAFLQNNDSIKIGDTTLLFTRQDFSEQKNAMHYFKRSGITLLRFLEGLFQII
jgi:pSer/pThr/pTyr-binding forkhead associated (FHA) protein